MNPPPPPYSNTRKHGNLLFVSAQTAALPDGSFSPDSFPNEVIRALANLKSTLEQEGSSLQHILQVHAYIRDPENLPLFEQIYSQVLSPPYPTRSVLTHCLEFHQFAIDCIAFIPNNDEDPPTP